MSIFSGFEGYESPSDASVEAVLRSGPVVLDANVLLDIYAFEEPARDLALDVLDSIREQLWIPHQAMREFWRNRERVVAGLKTPKPPILQLRNELLAIVNGLRPDTTKTDDLDEIRKKIGDQLSELEAAIDSVRGRPLDVDSILRDSRLDPVLGRLKTILDGRVGQDFKPEEEIEMVREGLARFDARTPPGFEDSASKADQLPERGTGDFLLWEQTLRHVSSASSNGFVLVTNDKKEDWRVILQQPKRRVLGVRPELVQEAISRTGSGFVSLFQSDFYRLVTTMNQRGDTSTSNSLVAASAVVEDSPGWTYKSYLQLLTYLSNGGHDDQVDAVIAAAENGGFVERATIYRQAGFEGDRTLNRFAFPVNRMTIQLVEDGYVSEDVRLPFTAVYEGSGKSLGYQVPDEFVDFELRRRAELDEVPWLKAAEIAAVALGREEAWTIDELVEEIRRSGLRNLEHVATPETTLRRDLTARDQVAFETLQGGRFRLASAPE